MGPLLSLLFCELSVFVKENPDIKKKNNLVGLFLSWEGPLNPSGACYESNEHSFLNFLFLQVSKLDKETVKLTRNKNYAFLMPPGCIFAHAYIIVSHMQGEQIFRMDQPHQKDQSLLLIFDVNFFYSSNGFSQVL